MLLYVLVLELVIHVINVYPERFVRSSVRWLSIITNIAQFHRSCYSNCIVLEIREVRFGCIANCIDCCDHSTHNCLWNVQNPAKMKINDT